VDDCDYYGEYGNDSESDDHYDDSNVDYDDRNGNNVEGYCFGNDSSCIGDDFEMILLMVVMAMVISLIISTIIIDNDDDDDDDDADEKGLQR
jgi:hypothetical protein